MYRNIYTFLVHPVVALVIGAVLAVIGANLKKRLWLSRLILIFVGIYVMTAGFCYPEIAPMEHRLIISLITTGWSLPLLLLIDIFILKPAAVPDPEVRYINQPPDGYALVKVEPNIVPLQYEARTTEVYEDKNGVLIEGSNDASFPAFILPLRNTRPRLRAKGPQLPIDTARDVAVELSFRCFEVGTSPKVHPGVWLNEQSARVSFNKEQRRNIVIATSESGRLNAVERQITSAFPDGRTHRTVIGGSLIGLTIRLLGYDFMATYVLEVDGDNGMLKISDIKEWRLGKSMNYRIQGLEWRNEFYSLTVDDKLEQYADKIREWGEQCSLFMERFVSAEAAKAFRDQKPALDDAIKGMPPPGIVDDRPSLAKKLFPRIVNYSLEGYLEARLKVLESYEQSLTPVF